MAHQPSLLLLVHHPGTFIPLKKWLVATRDVHGLDDLLTSLVAGAGAGCVGAALGTPFQLVKTRMQVREGQRARPSGLKRLLALPAAGWKVHPVGLCCDWRAHQPGPAAASWLCRRRPRARRRAC